MTGIERVLPEPSAPMMARVLTQQSQEDGKVPPAARARCGGPILTRSNSLDTSELQRQRGQCEERQSVMTPNPEDSGPSLGQPEVCLEPLAGWSKIVVPSLSTAYHKSLPSLTTAKGKGRLEAGGEILCEVPNPAILLA